MQKRKLHHVPGHRLTFKKPPEWEPDRDPGRCQAWSRQNARQCNNPPKYNQPYCRMHWKNGVQGNKYALKYGLYSVGLHEDEKELWPHLKTGDLTDEINLMRLQLRRFCKAQRLWEEQRGHYNNQVRLDVEAAVGSAMAGEFFDLQKIEIKEGYGVATMVPIEGGEPVPIGAPQKEIKVIRRKKDFTKEIKALVNSIRSLEATQAELNKELHGEDTARKLADDIRAFGENIGDTMPGGLMFGGPVQPAQKEQPETSKRTL